MTWQDYLNYVLFQFQHIRNHVLIIVLLTVLMFLLLYICAHNLKFKSRFFRWLSLFYQLHGYPRFRLAYAWLRLAYLISILTLFQPLKQIHFVLYIMLSLLYLVDIKAPHRIFTNGINIVLELVGVIVANALCGYMTEVFMDVQYLAIYILTAVFFGCFGIYVFLSQLLYISEERIIDKEKMEST